MMKGLLAIVSGLLAAFLIVLITDYTMGAIYMPQGMDMNDQAAMKNFISTAPKGVFLLQMAGYTLAAFTCSFIAVSISKSVRRGLLATLLFFILTVVNYFSLPHPLWAIFGGSVAILLGGYLGTRFLKK